MAKQVFVGRAIPNRRGIFGICAVLAAMTWLVFGQTTAYQFVTYGDPQYVYANPDDSEGGSLPRLFWVFTHTMAGNWQPLTTVSDILDRQLYGLDTAGH